MRRKCTSRWLTATGIIAWVAVLSVGFVGLADHTSKAGTPADSRAIWPQGANLRLAPNRPALLFFAHPKCPCTRAGITELERILAACPDRVECLVMVMQPDDKLASWSDTDTRRRLQHIPGVRVRVDVGGVEARRFGVKTSGQALLYGTNGRLLYSGGITPGRGHEGDSPGQDAVLDLIRHEGNPIDTFPVWGCPLQDAPSIAGMAACRP